MKEAVLTVSGQKSRFLISGFIVFILRCCFDLMEVHHGACLFILNLGLWFLEVQSGCIPFIYIYCNSCKGKLQVVTVDLLYTNSQADIFHW